MMLEGNRCERCEQLIRGAKALHRQTKYCGPCARVKKRENTECPLLPDDKREYMRAYMREYRRAHPGLSSRYVRRHRERKSKARADSSGGTVTLRCLIPTAALSLLLFKDASPNGWGVSLEDVSAVVVNLQVLAIHVAGLAFVVLLCWFHLAGLWRSKKK